MEEKVDAESQKLIVQMTGRCAEWSPDKSLTAPRTLCACDQSNTLYSTKLNWRSRKRDGEESFPFIEALK
ncbi:hypothetical protein LEMLEM_LOCUS22677 [Lemmus lemmus]